MSQLTFMDNHAAIYGDNIASVAKYFVRIMNNFNESTTSILNEFKTSYNNQSVV